jgi:hypothetical protein
VEELKRHSKGVTVVLAIAGGVICIVTLGMVWSQCFTVKQRAGYGGIILLWIVMLGMVWSQCFTLKQRAGYGGVIFLWIVMLGMVWSQCFTLKQSGHHRIEQLKSFVSGFPCFSVISG